MLIDDMLDVYERAVFTPSRDAATQGSFLRSYMLSLDLSASAVDALFRDKKLPGPSNMKKSRQRCSISDMSRIYSLLTQNYQAAIWREASPMSKSLKELLDGVAELAREELFESRVLPRDILKLSDAITDIFKAHCVLLGFEADLKEYLAQGILEKSKQNRLLEEKVMFSMLHLLDRLELDGSIRHDSDDNFQLLTINTNDEMVSTVCRQVANVIVNRFKKIESKKEIKEEVRLLENETEAPWMESEKEHVWIEREYFVFPATPDWVTLEFGAVNFTGADEFEFRNKLFSMAMGVLCTSEGPISGTRLRFFKFLVKADPVS